MVKNTNENKMISVIVPVYNVQAYLERCLNSILSQTYPDFEVICIDDGSTDASGKICDIYQERDHRIRVYHIENHGVSYARNHGLSVMRGDWFCFVDSDDWIEPDYIGRMYELAKEKQCEVAACGIDITYRYGKEPKIIDEEIFTFETSKECIQNFICSGNSMHGFVWNKLFSVSKFGEIRFDETVKVNEDCLYIYEIMSICNCACLTTLPLYHWYIRKDSACHKKAENADFSAANVFLQLFNKLQGKDMDAACTVLQERYIESAVQILLYAKFERRNPEVELAKRRCKEWKDEVWNRFGMKQKLKYWYGVCFRRF